MSNPFPTHLTEAEQPDGLAIETRGLQKRYGNRTALANLSLQVPVGAVYLLVGPNGAGKSTTMKTLMGLVRKDAGEVTVFGLDVNRDGPKVRANVGYIPDDAHWGYGWMRIHELFEYHSRNFPRWDAAYAKRLTSLFGIKMDVRLAALSKGERRRVLITLALVHRPPVLLLDEPTDGLDPIMRDETLAMLAGHLAETPTTVLLSTHHVEEVERLADYIGVISHGELRAQLSFAALQRELLQYRFQVPDGWSGASTLDGRVVRKQDDRREQAWTIWGSEREVVNALIQAGAQGMSVTPISLLDATICLLKPWER